jgi:Tfp pilus assembly protein PilF
MLVDGGLEAERSGRLLAEALEAEPESSAVLDSMGWWHYKKGEYGAALEYLYQAAAGQVRVDAEIWEHLGDTVYRLGRKAEAGQYWQKAAAEVKEREAFEKFLEKDRVRLENKLRQLSLEQDVAVAGLFGQAP